jgi:hypothetical protein
MLIFFLAVSILLQRAGLPGVERGLPSMADDGGAARCH